MLLFNDDDCNSEGQININGLREDSNWDPEGSCDVDDFSNTNGNDGCDILITNVGTYPDSCAHYRAENKFILESNSGLYKNFKIIGEDHSDEDDDHAQCFNNIKWRSNSENSHLCAYDNKDKRHYWFACDASAVKQIYEDTVYNDKNEKEIQKFICLPATEGGYAWKNINEIDSSVDADEDGVPDVLDCAPDNNKIFPKFNCGPKLNKETGEKVVDETTGEEIIECSVKGASEVCGDDVDNDCNVDTSDDCNKNKEACESNCLGKGEK